MISQSVVMVILRFEYKQLLAGRVLVLYLELAGAPVCNYCARQMTATYKYDG